MLNRFITCPLIIVAVFVLNACATQTLPAELATPKAASVVAATIDAAPDGEPTTSYEPMRALIPFAGTVMRGSWTEEDGSTVIDISYGEFILDGRAYQGTHKIEGSPYGGRTIIFYDEGSEEYIFHYFTTAGFHTMGTLTMLENGYRGGEKVEGHPSVAEVESVLTIEGDAHIVTVRYRSHDGEWSDAPPRTYRPYSGAKPFTQEKSE